MHHYFLERGLVILVNKLYYNFIVNKKLRYCKINFQKINIYKRSFARVKYRDKSQILKNNLFK